MLQDSDANVLAEMHPLAARGFNQDQSIYEAARPSYPLSVVEAVRTQLLPQLADPAHAAATAVLDLAAGTGKWTRQLLSLNIGSVVAVEPAEKMTMQFKILQPDVPIFLGSATSIPFPNESFDAVFVAQAFHWFASVSALQEICRVLKKGGLVVLIWNMEDKRTPWVARLREKYEKHEAGTPQYRLGLWREPFQDPVSLSVLRTLFELPFQERQFEHFVTNTRAGVWQRVLSKSYVAVLSEDQQEQLKGEVNEVLDEDDVPWVTGEDGETTVNFPYTTDLVWFRKRITDTQDGI